MDIRKTLFTFLSVCVSLSAFAQSDWDASEANAAYDFQEYQKAFELYKECFETDSTQIHCYERGAQSAYRLGDIANAKKLFHRLEQIDTINRLAFSQLSAIYELEKNAPKATKYYTKLRNLFPENPVYRRKLGQQYQAAGLMTEAFENYSAAYERMDSTEWALYHYEKALDEGISSNTDLYHRNLARMYNDAGKLREAIEHYKDAYKYGEDPLVLFYLARACDIYYKDKSVAVNYDSKYIRSSEPTEEYKQVAKDRRQHLREQMHQGK